MKPILFEAENYFNDLSLTKKSKKIPERLIFSKKFKSFAFNFSFHCRQLIFWDAASTFVLADGRRSKTNSNYSFTKSGKNQASFFPLIVYNEIRVIGLLLYILGELFNGSS